jgi:hypothetical protein
LFGLELKIIFSKHKFEVKDLISKFEKKTFGSSQGGSVMTLPSPFIEMNDIMFKKCFMIEHYPFCGLGFLLMWA